MNTTELVKLQTTYRQLLALLLKDKTKDEFTQQFIDYVTGERNKILLPTLEEFNQKRMKFFLNNINDFHSDCNFSAANKQEIKESISAMLLFLKGL